MNWASKELGFAYPLWSLWSLCPLWFKRKNKI